MTHWIEILSNWWKNVYTFDAEFYLDIHWKCLWSPECPESWLQHFSEARIYFGFFSLEIVYFCQKRKELDKPVIDE